MTLSLIIDKLLYNCGDYKDLAKKIFFFHAIKKISKNSNEK